MTTTLSSRLTPFHKFVLPLLVAGGFGFGAWRAYLHPGEVHGPTGWSRDYAWALMLAFGVVIGAVLWLVGGRLVCVELDEDELIISDYRNEIRVPLANVEAIKGPGVTNPPRYALIFEESTEFGRRVRFMPPRSWASRWRSEPAVIVELRSAWVAAREKAGKSS